MSAAPCLLPKFRTRLSKSQNQLVETKRPDLTLTKMSVRVKQQTTGIFYDLVWVKYFMPQWCKSQQKPAISATPCDSTPDTQPPRPDSEFGLFAVAMLLSSCLIRCFRCPVGAAHRTSGRPSDCLSRAANLLKARRLETSPQQSQEFKMGTEHETTNKELPTNDPSGSI